MVSVPSRCNKTCMLPGTANWAMQIVRLEHNLQVCCCALQYPLEQITSAFINTSAGAMTAQNTPLYLYPITVQTMLDARAQHLQGFNAYRQAFELPRFTR